MTSLIAIPFLIGSVPLGLAVVGANHFLKDKRKTNKFLYWGGITASAFVGWSVSNMLMTRYVESEVFSADNSRHYRKNDVLYERNVESMICNCGNTSGWIVSVFDGQNPPEGCFNRAYDISCPSCHENIVTYQSRDSPKSPFKIVYGEYGTQITPAYGAESKFKEPYMKGDKIDMKRGNDGRFRRRLVVPLEKNAETTTQKSYSGSHQFSPDHWRVINFTQGNSEGKAISDKVYFNQAHPNLDMKIEKGYAILAKRKA